LQLQLGIREIEAIPEVLALPALMPRVQVNLQLAVAMTCPQRVHADLKNFPNHRLSELELFQVRVNGAKTSLHVFLCSPLTEKQQQ
jgi:hypothetical protein